MRNFRLNIFLSSMICLMAVLLVVTGCGRKEQTQTATVAGTTGVEQQPIATQSTAPITEERTFYDFERGLGGWEIPMWAEGKIDHVAKNLQTSQDVASKGNSSMKMDTEFPGGMWTAGLVEIQQYLDLSPYRVIRADIYLPQGAPLGLKGKIILTVGDSWKWVEMSRSYALKPGEWVTLTADLTPGSVDWRRIQVDDAFRQDVRKIDVRVESNNKPAYTGPIYIDNIRVIK